MMANGSAANIFGSNGFVTFEALFKKEDDRNKLIDSTFDEFVGLSHVIPGDTYTKIYGVSYLYLCLLAIMNFRYFKNFHKLLKDGEEILKLIRELKKEYTPTGSSRRKRVPAETRFEMVRK